MLQKEMATYLCDRPGLPARPSAGNNGELRLSAAKINGWLANGKGDISQGTSEASCLSDRDKGSWLATICGGLGAALAAGPVDLDDSDKVELGQRARSASLRRRARAPARCGSGLTR